MEKIILLHTNDLHSHLENWPKIRRFLLNRKQEETPAKKIITVDLGDFVDRWHPLTEATNGQANVRLMNQIHYDAATIGNNEGVGNSKAELNHLYDGANFDILLDNLFDKQTLQPPEWVKQAKILTTEQGTKVGLLAFTAPFPLTYEPNGWDIRQVMDILPELVADIRPKVDVLVLMSHLGISVDRKIARELPEIDVILGSHTHHLFETGEKIGNVQLAAAGKYGYYVGEVHVTVDAEHRIQKTSARTFPTEKMLALPEDQEEIDGYLQEGHQLLAAKKVADLPFALRIDLQEEHPMINYALAAVKEAAKTEAAILNSGLFLKDIPAGLVDQDQLHTALPHPMHLIKVTLDGNNLIRLILEMEKNRHFLINFPVMGMGFRGKVFGHLVYDGIAYDHVNHQVRWLGELVDPELDYTIATIDHFMFVPFFPTIEIASRYEFLFPDFIRSVLGDYLHTHYPIK
ncbi:bifunctional UDP-sugar hydrolase/5'-nucleotidase [Enterococcus dongliensis]|uniref:Bifunctional UDP-sugar hydrolase/5'-nucleotidase n=1 Tax=Enterococcus dongliensis TaxID=2559925 RepID=A0AAP5NJJ0_9ENTE|nr:bifunctional UDP-sugar hydrolase/5'-nucleotidase [Enterococcus dongliensis]MDT2598013.1 bifunctional UDP-sugar hydrolase/5'-nucleotidase [Enterococcus dongliensis]MDT2614525.1 bifunctional UDP-sugar hydrolase/5'-nucleotidase [Enterococcus dongliensis]MDT2635424.1 bifunctional UDP-sugar hydrolase/5'-nucleotidase [Enterococcus dongliensis]MDT2637995.1 bifunctional UDP-sugar hydrolase/5'-nucleotidase [Enterococcus dongliensis]MDT2640623.1 bifunctional UDP-sugar hydrolase/5'-nucleotidase [Enter